MYQGYFGSMHAPPGWSFLTKNQDSSMDEKIRLTHEQIRKGFWYFDCQNDWPPEPITYIEDYTLSEHLNLVITQLDISYYRFIHDIYLITKSVV
jgi:hypothetical protein